MNPKINKVIDDIEKTKAKITELQALLPELERKRIDMENTEIIRLVRSADIAPADFPEFVRSLKAARAAVPEQPAVVEPPIVAERDAVNEHDADSADSIAGEGAGMVSFTTHETTHNGAKGNDTDDTDAEPYETDNNYTETQEEDDADV